MEISVKHLVFITISLVVLTIVVTLSLFRFVPRKDANSNGNINIPPENFVHAQALNVLWVLFSLIIYIKYRQVKDILSRYSIDNKKVLNRSAMQVGLAAAFGISIMANFQETNLFYGHCCGIVLVYGFGAVYQCMQTCLYVILIKILGQKRRTFLRIILSITSMGAFIIYFVFAIITRKTEFDKENIYHDVSVVFQWICTISTVLYVTLFYWEFQKITLYEPDVFVEDRVKTELNMERTNEGFQDT